jgi:hypothetical protein
LNPENCDGGSRTSAAAFTQNKKPGVIVLQLDAGLRIVRLCSGDPVTS